MCYYAFFYFGEGELLSRPTEHFAELFASGIGWSKFFFFEAKRIFYSKVFLVFIEFMDETKTLKIFFMQKIWTVHRNNIGYITLFATLSAETRKNCETALLYFIGLWRVTNVQNGSLYGSCSNTIKFLAGAFLFYLLCEKLILEGPSGSVSLEEYKRQRRDSL